MTRIFEYGTSESDEILTIDVHDENISLVERALFMMTFMGDVCCDDLMCSDEELAIAINEIEKRGFH